MKNLVLSLAALLVAAFPMAAQEEVLAPLPGVDGERVAITLTTGEDGETQLVGSDNFPSPKANAKAAPASATMIPPTAGPTLRMRL